MAKITGPLFGTAATGKIGDLGHFRRGRSGPEWVSASDPSRRKPPPARPINACFAAAKAAHSALPVHRVRNHGVWRQWRDQNWGDFWRQWLIDHPECSS